MSLRVLSCLAMFVAGPVAAQETERADFIRDNLIAIFYHEFGHALIYRLELPIYGQEEDAADVASVMLMDRLYENDRATEMVIAAADGFNGEIVLAGDEAPAYWDTHGADEQRYFNTICIFHGGDPEGREDMITVMGLPEERAESCMEEYDQANFSWGNVLEQIAQNQLGDTFVADVRDTAAALTVDVITAEVAALNADFGLAKPLPIVIDSCGEPNAYFDPNADNIIICSEFETHLGNIYDALEQ